MIKGIIIFTILFSLDNLIGVLMPRTLWGMYIIVPYSLLIAICLHCFYEEDKNYLSILAFVFGFILDIYNANLIGLYAVLFPLVVIITKKYIVPIAPLNFVSIFYISVIAIMSIEIIVFILVVFATGAATTFFSFIQHRLLITLVFNVMLLAVMYWPLVKLFRSEENRK